MERMNTLSLAMMKGFECVDFIELSHGGIKSQTDTTAMSPFLCFPKFQTSSENIQFKFSFVAMT
jgi:hypothetical protein